MAAAIGSGGRGSGVVVQLGEMAVEIVRYGWAVVGRDEGAMTRRYIQRLSVYFRHEL